jgi:hypothetical protein
MSTHPAATTRPARPRTWRSGLASGLAVGLSLWGLYFIQASTVDWLFWDAMVVPAVVVVSGIAMAIAALRPPLRSFCIGLAGGVVAVLLAALLAIPFLFAVLNLE